MAKTNFEKHFGISAKELSSYAKRQHKRQIKGLALAGATGLGGADVDAQRDPVIKKLKKSRKK